MANTKKNKKSVGSTSSNTKMKDSVKVTNNERDPSSIIEDKPPYFMKYLKKGEAKAISMHDLCALCHVDDRVLRNDIKDARIKGIVVCSSVRGYFLPSTREEKLKWYRTHRSRAMTTLRSLKALRAELRKMGISLEQLGEKKKQDDE